MMSVILTGGGVLFLLAAVLGFLLKLDVASDGGRGGAPYLDGAVFPPIAATFGIHLLVEAAKATLPGGLVAYIVIWLGLTALAAGMIVKVSERADC